MLKLKVVAQPNKKPHQLMGQTKRYMQLIEKQRCIDVLDCFVWDHMESRDDTESATFSSIR